MWHIAHRKNAKYRLVGVGLAGLSEKKDIQLDFFTKKENDIEKALDKIRNKFGDQIIKNGSAFAFDKSNNHS